MSTAVAEKSKRPPRGRLRPRQGAVLSRVRPPGRARAVLRVSGVLRAAGDRLRLPAGDPRGDRGRAAQHLALQGAAAGAERHRAEPQHRARLHPAAQGAQPRPRARHRQPVGQGRLDQPHQLLQGPGRGLRAERRPRARRQGLRLPQHRQPGQRRRGGGRPRRHQDRGLHPEQPRAAQAGQLRRLHRAAGRGERQLRRRQQARLRDRRRGGGLGVRERQRPPLLRRGLQDAGLRDRRAARLAAARPDRDPGRVAAPS